MIAIHKKYIYKKFFLCFAKVFIVFSSIVLIMNMFEEISFFKNEESNILLPVFLTLLNLPSLLFEIFPFMFLITSIYFFIETFELDEINTYKTYGITNLKLVQILSFVTFLTGILIITIFYTFSTNLKFFYLELKNQYSNDDKYLAAVTTNGLWIRDTQDNQIKYINADKIEGENLLNISISEFDKNFDLERSITAEKANIKETTWILKDVVVNEKNNTKKFADFKVITNFNLERILSIFDNLSSINLFQLHKLEKDYELLGYSINVINGHKHRIYSYPIYITLMVIIGSILMLNTKHNKSKIFHIVLGILISVIVYYINYFFKVVIETQDIPYFFSIWGPQLILSMIILINLIKLNEK
tara:strand:- start:13 stop:1089 length:1077 start_codon:yes stop_codon:yes gene_type:complete